MPFRIRDWDGIFENASSRKLKHLQWVPVPNKTDGEGYCALVDHPNAAAHLGAWYAILEAASKQSPRGNLPGGITHDLGGICRSLSRTSRLPADVFREVIPRLLSIGWIEEIPSIQQFSPKLLGDSADLLAESAAKSTNGGMISGAHRREQKGIELQGTAVAAAAFSSPCEFPLTLAECRKHDPATDAGFVTSLANRTIQMCLSSANFPQNRICDVGDKTIAGAVAKSYETGPPGHRNGLLLNRVPSIVLTWGEKLNGGNNQRSS